MTAPNFFFSFSVVLYCFRIKCKDYISMYDNVPSLTSLGRAGKATRVQQPQKRMWKHGKCVARRCGFHLSCTVGSTAFNKFSVLLTWTLLSLQTFVKKVLEERSSYLKVKQKIKQLKFFLNKTRCWSISYSRRPSRHKINQSGSNSITWLFYFSRVSKRISCFPVWSH